MIRYKDNIYTVSKGTFCRSTNLVFVYRSPSSSPFLFVSYLIDIVEVYNIEIFLGNFNINAFLDTQLNKIT